MQNKPILYMTFNDAITGQPVKAHVTFEQWDAMVVVLEKIVGDYYKKQGLRKDLR